MIVFKLREYLLHNRFSEKNRFCPYPEFVTVLINRSHLTIIQVDNLPMPAYKRSLLLLEVLRIDTGNLFLLLGHFKSRLGLTLFSAPKLSIFPKNIVIFVS